jgi:rhamnosyltransferase
MKGMVIILMATYNGGLFIEEQIQSIIKQSYTDWNLIIRDDGSTDKTIELINSFVSRDSRIKRIETNYPGHGSCSNFSEVYNWAKHHLSMEYVMFSDQDDIWLPTKVEESLGRIIEAENKFGLVPIMAYGNLQLIDHQGRNLDRGITLLEHVPLNKLLVQNNAFGCTMIFNKALADTMDYIPHFAENHDYWVAMVATALGRTVFLSKALILYRQHSSNVTAQGSGFKQRYTKYVKHLELQIDQYVKKVRMLEHFLVTYRDKLNPKDANMLQEFISLFHTGNSLKPVMVVFRYKFFRNGLFQNLGLFYLLCLQNHKIHSRLKLQKSLRPS